MDWHRRWCYKIPALTSWGRDLGLTTCADPLDSIDLDRFIIAVHAALFCGARAA